MAAQNAGVWDFGGVEESDSSLYTNYITEAFLEGWSEVGDSSGGNKGRFLNGGAFDLGGGLTLFAEKGDLMYGETQRSFASAEGAALSYADGYRARGLWRADGPGGEDRRFIRLDNVEKGSALKVYTADGAAVNFTYLGEDGAQSEEQVSVGDGGFIALFTADFAGSYEVWFGAAGGIPAVSRVVLTPPVQVTLTLDTEGFAASSTVATGVAEGDLTVRFVNAATGKALDVPSGGGKAVAPLAPGYTYRVRLRGAVGFDFADEQRTFEVTARDLAAGRKDISIPVSLRRTYEVTGRVSGFEEGCDTSRLVIRFIPEESSDEDPVTAVTTEGVAAPDLSGLGEERDLIPLLYTAALEPGVLYTAVLEGVEGYEIREGGTARGTLSYVQNIEVAPLAPRAAPEKKAASDTLHRIVWGETLRSISRAYYGDESAFKRISDYNGIEDPDLIISGGWLLIPAE